MKKFTLDFEKPLIDLDQRLQEMKAATADNPELAEEISRLEQRFRLLREKIYSSMTPWQKVQVARHPERPRTLDYIMRLTTDSVELHGDRLFRDDKAVVGGLAWFEGYRVVWLGHQKGKSTKENIERNFGSPHPEGIRKGIRLMSLAEKFGLPLVCFIDTAGAYPGIGAEERGQANAISASLLKLSSLRTKVVAINIGEGGSGGALAFGVADRVLMMENAYYSVSSPEACASILWRNAEAKELAAKALRLTAEDLKELSAIDSIIPEPLGGAHHDYDGAAAALRNSLLAAFAALERFDSVDDLVAARYRRLRNTGVFTETNTTESERRVPKHRSKD